MLSRGDARCSASPLSQIQSLVEHQQQKSQKNHAKSYPVVGRTVDSKRQPLCHLCLCASPLHRWCPSHWANDWWDDHGFSQWVLWLQPSKVFILWVGFEFHVKMCLCWSKLIHSTQGLLAGSGCHFGCTTSQIYTGDDPDVAGPCGACSAETFWPSINRWPRCCCGWSWGPSHFCLVVDICLLMFGCLMLKELELF